MTEKTKIDELAKAIERTGMLDSFSKCEIVAEELYRDGYCKQSEGEWIDVPSYGSGWMLGGERVFPKQCSNCGNIFAYAPYPYCPKCGAKMKGGDE